MHYICRNSILVNRETHMVGTHTFRAKDSRWSLSDPA